jgi:hypothetical protein
MYMTEKDISKWKRKRKKEEMTHQVAVASRDEGNEARATQQGEVTRGKGRARRGDRAKATLEEGAMQHSKGDATEATWWERRVDAAKATGGGKGDAWRWGDAAEATGWGKGDA